MDGSTIDLTDYFSLVAVWELNDNGWTLITITRPKPAILLCHHQKRLAFPTCINPNLVWRNVGKKCQTDEEFLEQVIKPANSRKRILELLETHPGQSIKLISARLGISSGAVRVCLRLLKEQRKVHCQPSLLDSRTKLYYLGLAPANASISCATNTPKVVLPSLQKEPALKVYFVTPRTLEKVINDIHP